MKINCKGKFNNITLLKTFFAIISFAIVFYLFFTWFCIDDNDCSETIEKMPTDARTCVSCQELNKGPSFQSTIYKIPQCSNLVKNMVKGSWVEGQYEGIEKDKEIYDDLITKFRVKHEGFSKYPFRRDGLCGFQHQIRSKFVTDASSWCDTKSYKPCCSNSLSGVCIKESECISKQSVNLKRYVHAEVSNWIPTDSSCKMEIYNQETACALLHQNQVKSIGFAGNSLMRNMYSVMLQLLTNNYYNGSIGCCIPNSLRQKCVGSWQNWDKFCLASALVSNSDFLPGNGICHGYLNTLMYLKGYWLANHGIALKKHITTLLDKPGTYLLVGIGVHDQYIAKTVINEYLKPSFEVLSGHDWPKFIWIHQLKTGIFKPPGFVSFHGTDEDIDRYVEEIDRFCFQYKIPALDLRPLTTGVWSVDGTHYGTGVNLMKIQLFLNLLTSGQVF